MSRKINSKHLWVQNSISFHFLFIDIYFFSYERTRSKTLLGLEISLNLLSWRFGNYVTHVYNIQHLLDSLEFNDINQ